MCVFTFKRIKMEHVQRLIGVPKNFKSPGIFQTIIRLDPRNLRLP
jgi:hypothetical protein